MKIPNKSELTEKRRRAAYKLGVSDLEFDQLCCILITSDGRGDKIKTAALERLISLVQKQ